ncbi:MAG: hypothetical protein Q4B19_05380, partial [Clostridia bacterium]|nr:hypothetical protein [Clostridia bacterium]
MRNKLGSAINRRVSGVRLTAEDERALLASVMERKDEIVKKKISVAMVAAAVLIFAAVTCAFAAGMNATPTPTPLAPADDALLASPTPSAPADDALLVTPEPTLVAPEPTPVPAFSESEWNDSASDGVVNMKMQYVSVEGAYVTMKVRLTPVRSEQVYLALNNSESGVDSYPGRWNLVINPDDLSLILPQALDSGRRSTQVAVDEYGLTFTLCGWLREETTDVVHVAAATGGDCPPLSISVKCAPNDANTTEIFSGAFDADAATVNRIACAAGDDFASVAIDYTTDPAPVYMTAHGNYMHRDPNCGGMQNAARYDDPREAQLAAKPPCPACWYDAVDADALFESVYALLNPGVDVPAYAHPNPISNFANAILNDGSRAVYLFYHVESIPCDLPGYAIQITHMDEDRQ